MKERWRCLIVVLIVFLAFPGSLLLAANKPSTAAELAMYKGSDRQQILEEGAKKEGKITFYTSGTIEQSVGPLVDAFKKRYPFINVDIWRAGTNALTPRIVEEFKAGKSVFDNVEGTQANMMVLQKLGIIQPFYSPNLIYMEKDAITPAADGGAYTVVFRATGIGVGYNTKLINKSQLPKTYQDLLDPKWKGKMAIAGSNTGTSWVGVILNTHGEEFLKRLSQQDIVVHMVSGFALLNMVANGEFAFSPTIFDSHAIASKEKGAPVDWFPLEPVHVNVGQIALAKEVHHPHAALLFADFELSKEGAEIQKSKGYAHLRKDVPALTQPYKKYFGSDSIEEVKNNQELFNRYFLKK